MKRIVIFPLLLISLSIFGQEKVLHKAVSFILNKPIQESSSYIARDYIQLLPGFNFVANNN